MRGMGISEVESKRSDSAQPMPSNFMRATGQQHSGFANKPIEAVLYQGIGKTSFQFFVNSQARFKIKCMVSGFG